jgi:hypothetical protein
LTKWDSFTPELKEKVRIRVTTKDLAKKMPRDLDGNHQAIPEQEMLLFFKD